MAPVGSNPSTTQRITSVITEYHELPENFTIKSWGDLADDLLCAGVDAAGIRDALADVYPYPTYHGFVIVQDNSGGRATVGSGDSHYATNLCGKNMFVWMKVGSSVGACSANAASAAQTLIDRAIYWSSTPNGVMAYIQSCKFN